MTKKLKNEEFVMKFPGLGNLKIRGCLCISIHLMQICQMERPVLVVMLFF